MNQIFIDVNSGLSRIAIIEDDHLVEFYEEDSSNESLLGNIYRARVVNVLQGMDSAFVDIGEGKNAYLHVKDALEKEKMYDKEKHRINQVLKGGEELIVQVTKEPLGNKGPKITTHISLPGRYIVITPFSNRINVSKKINDSEEIQRLKELGEALKKDDIGMIFRTVVEGVDRSLIEEEYAFLTDIYDKILLEKNFLPTPKLIYSELGLVYQTIRDNFKDDSKVVVNNKEVYENLKVYNNYLSLSNDQMEYDSKFSIDDDSKIQAGIKEALNRKVDLKSGGYIIIDETEALTAIDINTGKFTGSYSLKDTVLKTNLEACKVIARQIKLRDIGGIIIIDFIDMREQEHIDIILSELARCFESDKNKPRIVDITKLCLVEVTRKKNRATLDSKVSSICPKCNGRGRIRNIRY